MKQSENIFAFPLIIQYFTGSETSINQKTVGTWDFAGIQMKLQKPAKSICIYLNIFRFVFYCTSHVYILSFTCRNLFIAIGLGQVLSLLNCGTAVTSGLLQQQSVTIPTGKKFNICKLTFLIYRAQDWK